MADTFQNMVLLACVWERGARYKSCSGRRWPEGVRAGADVWPTSRTHARRNHRSQPTPPSAPRRLRPLHSPLMPHVSPSSLLQQELSPRSRLVLAPARMGGGGFAAGAPTPLRFARACCSAAAWRIPPSSAARAYPSSRSVDRLVVALARVSVVCSGLRGGEHGDGKTCELCHGVLVL